jgi:hypothetical protein
MSVVEKLKNPKTQQNLLEVILPIAGYLFWDWSLLIIIVFYLIDFLASQCMFNFKLYYAQKHQNNWFKFVLPVSISVFVTIFIFLMIAIWSSLVSKISEIQLKSELLEFAKDELWLLFPVILLSYYMMDKLQYYMPRRFMQTNVKSYSIKNIKANLIATVLVVMASLLYPYFAINDLVIVLIIVVIKLVFELVIKSKLLNME